MCVTFVCVCILCFFLWILVVWIKLIDLIDWKDCTQRFVLLKLTTDRHEASRGLIATAALLVQPRYICINHDVTLMINVYAKHNDSRVAHKELISIWLLWVATIHLGRVVCPSINGVFHTHCTLHCTAPVRHPHRRHSSILHSSI